MCEISRRGWRPQYWPLVILPHGIWDGNIFQGWTAFQGEVWEDLGKVSFKNGGGHRSLVHFLRDPFRFGMGWIWSCTLGSSKDEQLQCIEHGLHDSFSWYITECHLRIFKEGFQLDAAYIDLLQFRKVVFFPDAFFPPKICDEPGMEGFPFLFRAPPLTLNLITKTASTNTFFLGGRQQLGLKHLQG